MAFFIWAQWKISVNNVVQHCRVVNWKWKPNAPISQLLNTNWQASGPSPPPPPRLTPHPPLPPTPSPWLRQVTIWLGKRIPTQSQWPPSYDHTWNHSYNHIIILQNDYMKGVTNSVWEFVSHLAQRLRPIDRMGKRIPTRCQWTPSYNHTCNHSYNHIIILKNDYMKGFTDSVWEFLSWPNVMHIFPVRYNSFKASRIHPLIKKKVFTVFSCHISKILI